MQFRDIRIKFKVDWLDKLVFREIEQINEKEKKSGDLLHLLIETQKIYRYDKKEEKGISYYI